MSYMGELSLAITTEYRYNVIGLLATDKRLFLI